MSEKTAKIGIVSKILLLAVILAAAFWGRSIFKTAATIDDLLTENKKLKQAITNLTLEDQIGYAKVVSQENIDGKILTTIKFVETDRDDKLKKVFENQYTIQGDIVHFDALIVKFTDQMVMDGQQKAIYLWRRIYAENTAPENAMIIEPPNAEPPRYKGLLKMLPEKERNLFWANIWDLANDPQKLKQYGITAAYGNVVYSKLKPNIIYIFKITPAGQLYPQVIPEM